MIDERRDEEPQAKPEPYAEANEKLARKIEREMHDLDRLLMEAAMPIGIENLP